MAGFRDVRARLLVAALSTAIVAPNVLAAPPRAVAADPTPTPTTDSSPSPSPSPTPTSSASPEPSRAPASEAPTASPQAPEPEPSVDGTELVDQRTETSRTFSNDDGTLTTELFPEPIHFRPDPGAAWQPIELTFRPVAGADKATRLTDSPVAVTAAPGGDSRGFLTVTLDGHPISLHPVTPSADSRASSEPTTDRSTARIAEALPGIDLLVSASPTGVSTFFVLAAAPREPSITFLVDAPGLRLVPDPDTGRVGLVDRTGTRIGAFLAPYAVDSTPDEATGSGRRRPT